MNKGNLIITPHTKIGELLDAYPGLEHVLFELSPAFAKLKNPILRKTVAKVATLQQAAIVGKLAVEQVVNRLRMEVGQTALSEVLNEEASFQNPPDWFEETKISLRYDVTPVINAGNSPMAEILSQVKTIKDEEIFELKSPFIPAPIIDKLKEKGFESWSIQEGNSCLNYFHKKRP